MKITKMKIFILVISIIMSMVPMNMVGAKTKTPLKITSKKVTIYKGKSKTIRVKNTKNFKITKSNKKIQIKKIGKKIKITAIKAGQSRITVKAKGFKTTKITVTIKNKNDSNNSKDNKDSESTKNDNGLYTHKDMEGCGAKYSKDIESYPWLNDFSKLNDATKYVYQQQWKKLPAELLDAMVYSKTQITFSNDSKHYTQDNIGITYYTGTKTNNGMINDIKIYIQYNKNPTELSSILIHEAAHAYVCVMENSFGLNVMKETEIEYKQNKNMYGSYGSNNLEEFFCEKIANVMLKVPVMTKETMAELYSDGANVEERVREVDNKYGKKRYLTVYIINLKCTYSVMTYNDIDYVNGMTVDEFLEWRKQAVTEYYEKIYESKTGEYDKITIRACAQAA